MSRSTWNRRLHAAARDAGLDHADLRDLAPMVLGEDDWFRASRSLANVTDSELERLVWTVEGWGLVETVRGQKGAVDDVDQD